MRAWNHQASTIYIFIMVLIKSQRKWKPGAARLQTTMFVLRFSLKNNENESLELPGFENLYVY